MFRSPFGNFLSPSSPRDKNALPRRRKSLSGGTVPSGTESPVEGEESERKMTSLWESKMGMEQENPSSSMDFEIQKPNTGPSSPDAITTGNPKEEAVVSPRRQTLTHVSASPGLHPARESAATKFATRLQQPKIPPIPHQRTHRRSTLTHVATSETNAARFSAASKLRQPNPGKKSLSSPTERIQGRPKNVNIEYSSRQVVSPPVGESRGAPVPPSDSSPQDSSSCLPVPKRSFWRRIRPSQAPAECEPASTSGNEVPKSPPRLDPPPQKTSIRRVAPKNSLPKLDPTPQTASRRLVPKSPINRQNPAKDPPGRHMIPNANPARRKGATKAKTDESGLYPRQLSHEATAVGQKKISFSPALSSPARQSDGINQCPTTPSMNFSPVVKRLAQGQQILAPPFTTSPRSPSRPIASTDDSGRTPRRAQQGHSGPTYSPAPSSPVFFAGVDMISPQGPSKARMRQSPLTKRQQLAVDSLSLGSSGSNHSTGRRRTAPMSGGATNRTNFQNGPPTSGNIRAALSPASLSPNRQFGASSRPMRGATTRRASLSNGPLASGNIRAALSPVSMSPKTQFDAASRPMSGGTTRRASIHNGPLTSGSIRPGLSPSPLTPKRQFGAASRLDQGPSTPGVPHSAKQVGKRLIRKEGLPLLNNVHDKQGSSSSNNSRLYEYARQCEWGKVSEECRLFPRDAKCVDEVDGFTALHLAVMSRANPAVRDREHEHLQPAPIKLIEQLVIACPEAAITRCSSRKYTPLTYACLVLHHGYNMEDSAEMVSILLYHAPQSAYVFTDDGFSALDVHILSYSRNHNGKDKESYTGGQASTVVLKALLLEKPDLAEARPYKNKFRGPIELLYRSNLDAFKHCGDGVGDDRLRRGFAEASFPTNATTQSDWWAWKWVAMILRFAPRPSPRAKDVAAFMALHAAASLVGCPLPVLSIAARTYAEQLSTPDKSGTLGNLPLHEVCSWVCDKEILSGDPFSLRRKAMAIQCLLEEYPNAAQIKNNMGETPLQLAIESCTPWDGGLEVLVRANPASLAIPRTLRECTDGNDLLLSKSLYGDDDESVDESDWEDPLEPVQGMYPFMVAAVMAYVPEDYLNAPSFVFADRNPDQRKEDVEKKELESVRSIYGLLRAKPEALSMYKPEAGAQQDTDQSVCSDDGSDYTEYTEVSFEDE
jgi:hypothetical protein